MLDVVITYLKEKYIVELKIWRGKECYENGLKQLAAAIVGQEVVGSDYKKKKIKIALHT